MDDGVRTHDNRNHNPRLCQLSYIHHRQSKILLKRIAGILYYAIIYLQFSLSSSAFILSQRRHNPFSRRAASLKIVCVAAESLW